MLCQLQVTLGDTSGKRKEGKWVYWARWLPQREGIGGEVAFWGCVYPITMNGPAEEALAWLIWQKWVPGLPGGASGKEPACQAGDVRHARSIPGWEGPLEEGMATHLPGESHGQRNLAGYSPWGRRELDTMKQLSTHVRVHGSLNSPSGWLSCSDCSGQVLCKVFFFLVLFLQTQVVIGNHWKDD